MKRGIPQFLGPIFLMLLGLAIVAFNGNFAAEIVNVREMKVEHRSDDFESLRTETRDHHHGHNNGFFPSKSHNKPKKPKSSYGTPRPQYGAPTKSYYSPPKGNYESPSYSKPSPAYNPPPYRPPVYSSPNYSPPSYNPPAYVPAYTEQAPAYQPPAYSPPAYSPPAPAYSKPSYPLPSEPEYPYKVAPETYKGVDKSVSNYDDFPTFDEFFKKSLKFDQFKI
ncbi:hypothetical protein DAPPUDRAFT_301722 [Daphnia pulex]|uniref:Uncharacterized protein n=1 Tax=Daphnia pulex TaxID=6669 RepID=E9HJU5_DAPPU|nr:hypothetical protein DAPPUDRAFT_301722 [Daphnia pulex]|eukprot:EFX68009.1 hypothetical protein DAPPUDRAFT_301722 [Daphnia pulex]